MATKFRTVSTFLTNVTALNDIATALRRSLLNNQAAIQHIDTVARTNFLERWEECRKDFQRILEMSEGAAIKFSATINYYLSLQEETNDPAEVDETIQELSAFHNKLSLLGLDQTAEFWHLDASLDKLENDIRAAVLAHKHSLSNEVENAAGRIPSLERELEELNEKKRQRQCEESWVGAQDLWDSYGSHMFKPESRTQFTAQLTHTGPAPQIRARLESPTRLLIGGWDFEEEYHIARIEVELRDMRAKLRQAESELQEYKSLNVDQVRDATDEIRRNLGAQCELQEAIFSAVKTKLMNESKSYLKALQDSRVDLSPAGQRAYRNAKHRIISSSKGWEQKAAVLVDEYAKKQK
ncbi:hypothetical protein GSI_07765 [Ganoderma sinense ZZ0214-1]|uniref:Uncharacterized protein n=1 Tax=Ganoderma sinense ZZ0214-1 TaxID=1077348 RepID=A0A2G8S8X2_9APHY|nr:hypothetical protein GSI_07670 [Ganoderma sinense ZZ0214-1]PIL30187.1 hypothetical protein GSI_07765 [Ganoderma sinense ZZ0214-1]